MSGGEQTSQAVTGLGTGLPLRAQGGSMALRGSSAGSRLPPCRPLVLVKKDPVPHTAGVAGEELIVPGFDSGGRAFQSLRITELAP